jgi:hypothetical protein
MAIFKMILGKFIKTVDSRLSQTDFLRNVDFTGND